MKSKPKGARYRNLILRSGVIYYERLAHGRRIRLSAKTDSEEEAASFRDAFEAHKGIGRVPFLAGEVPRFAEFAARYLAEDTAHLAPSTRSDRSTYLRADGPLIGFFGAKRIDEIDAPTLRAWWNQEVTAAGRSPKTGRCYLDVLGAILGYAVDLDILETSPVGAFRETLRRRARTQRGRAESDPEHSADRRTAGANKARRGRADGKRGRRGVRCHASRRRAPRRRGPRTQVGSDRLGR
jgi:hypothetical protein